MKQRIIQPFNMFIACMLCALVVACTSDDRYIGKYTSTASTDAFFGDNIIELMENGEGLWTCCNGEVKFSWYVKNNELRINTKEGGIMKGPIENNSFMITLPGNQQLTFKKALSRKE